MWWLNINCAECWILATFILSGAWNGLAVLSMPMIASRPLSPRSYFPFFVYVIERVFGPLLSSKYKKVLLSTITDKWCNCEKSRQICFFWTPKVLKYGLIVYRVCPCVTFAYHRQHVPFIPLFLEILEKHGKKTWKRPPSRLQIFKKFHSGNPSGLGLIVSQGSKAPFGFCQ